MSATRTSRMDRTAAANPKAYLLKNTATHTAMPAMGMQSMMWMLLIKLREALQGQWPSRMVR